METSCLFCGAKIENTKKTKYCSENCAKEFKKKKYREMNPKDDKRTNRIGRFFVSELEVVLDLISREYDVFYRYVPRPDFQIIILKNGIPYKIIVKTGHSNTAGKVYTTQPTTETHDILAIVCQDKIVYSPELP